MHNYSPCRHVKKTFLVNWTCSFQIQASLLQNGHFLLVGRWVFLRSVASTLKCFSLQHILYVLDGLLLHIEGCMILSVYKLEATMYYPPLEIVCSGICIYHHVEQNWSFCHTSGVCPILIWSCQLCKCGRLYLFQKYICLLLFASWKLLLSLHCKNALKWEAYSTKQVSSRVSQSSYFHSSVFWDEYLWSCSIFS